MALLKVLLLLGLGVSVNSDVSLQKRIIGGQNCDNTEGLYHVRVESSRANERIRCGGSLIHPEWILTAAQCWQFGTGWTNIAMLKVHPRTAGEQTQVIRDTPVIHTHHGQQHGIMLLKLQTPVTDVPLGRLPDCRNRLQRDDFVQLAGEGATTTGPYNERLSGAPLPAHLQCVNMKVVQISHFHKTYGHLFYASAPNKDICRADSGGAAVYSDIIYGVIYISGANYACQSPVGVLDVCKYLWWIKQTIGYK